MSMLTQHKLIFHLPPRDPNGFAVCALRFDSATRACCFAQDDRGVGKGANLIMILAFLRKLRLNILRSNLNRNHESL